MPSIKEKKMLVERGWSDLYGGGEPLDRDHAWDELERFAERWDLKYPMISASWTEHWERVVPFLGPEALNSCNGPVRGRAGIYRLSYRIPTRSRRSTAR